MTDERADLPTVSLPAALAGVAPQRVPRHIAIIMDGNGRWAQARELPRVDGHRAGAKVVREIVTACAELGLDALTLYCFSSENWKRPLDEIEALMRLYLDYLAQERPTLLDNNVRFRQIGRRDGLPEAVLDSARETEAATAHCTGLQLVLALNYGSRAEITDAVRAIARKIAAGELAPDEIDETTLADHLYTAGVPDPDLLVRTAGEMRLSNYLLWQISYAELHVTDVYWPEFDRDELYAAIRAFAGRDRRFGAIEEC